MTSIRQRLFCWVRDRLPESFRGEVFVRADALLNTAPPLVVYQMGKVGSGSVTRALRAAGLAHSVYFIHYLSRKGIAEARAAHSASAWQEIPRHLRHAQALRRRLDCGVTVPWLVVTIARDPIARTISDLFQNMAAFEPELLGADGKPDVDRIVEHLERQFAAFDESTDWVCTWYDRELGPAFDVDFYSAPFDTERGWSVSRWSTASVLALRTEDMAQVFLEAVSDLLGAQHPIALPKSNPTIKKPWAAAHGEVRERLRLPREVSERIYGSRFTRHFYSDAMRERFIERWSR